MFTASLDKALAGCRESSNFDVKAVLASLTEVSEGWSFEELDRLVDRSMAAALGTEACKVTSYVFLSEIKYLLEAKQREFGQAS